MCGDTKVDVPSFNAGKANLRVEWVRIGALVDASFEQCPSPGT